MQNSGKKLLTPTEKRPWISESIRNEHLYGEDSARGAEILFVAEGVTDCLVMLQAEYATVSPVTVRFRHDDVPKLLRLTHNTKKIYMVPDQENNGTGMKGAIDTAALLEANGRNAYIVELPRDDGTEKIDVTDYLRDNDKEAFDRLVSKARTPIQILIDEVAQKKLQPLELQEELGALRDKMAQVPEIKVEAYLTYLKTHLKVTGDIIKALRKEIQSAKESEKKWMNKDNSEASECIERMNSKHAAIMHGGKFLILNEITEPVFGRPDFTLSTVYDFKNRYLNTQVLDADTSNRKGHAVYSTEADLWLKSPDRREYSSIVFKPGGQVDGAYNLWRGLAIEPKKGDWSLFQNHILECACTNKPELYDWVLAWFADLFQNPGGERPGTSIVLRGPQGAGKGCLVTNVGEILGTHFLTIQNQWKALGRFNSHLRDALLVFLDEGFWLGDRTVEGVLKAMITEKYHMIEQKGKDPLMVENHLRVIMASNYAWVVPAGIEERRFCVLDVSPHRMGDHKYFQAVYAQMKNGGQAAMLHDLLEMDISSVNLRQIPRTEGLMDQIQHSMNGIESWYFQCLQEGEMEMFRNYRTQFDGGNGTILYHPDSKWPRVIGKSRAYADYLGHCDVLNHKSDRASLTSFGMQIGKLCPKRTDGRLTDGGRERVYYLPDLSECRRLFEKKAKMKVHWPGEEPQQTEDKSNTDATEGGPEWESI